jgi:predicted dithiol-disulfide oxidoreductase (DUF899 family)
LQRPVIHGPPVGSRAAATQAAFAAARAPSAQNHLDVTLLCFSRAPLDRLTAYKQRMGWQFPYVSTFNTDFAFDFRPGAHRGTGAGEG